MSELFTNPTVYYFYAVSAGRVEGFETPTIGVVIFTSVF